MFDQQFNVYRKSRSALKSISQLGRTSVSPRKGKTRRRLKFGGISPLRCKNRLFCLEIAFTRCDCCLIAASKLSMLFDWCILWSILSVSYSFSLHFRSISRKHRASLSETAFIPSKMIIIGLTGGICSGKSTVSQILESCGAYIVDADKLGHAAYLPDSTCYVKLVNNFGSQIVNEDRTINRPALGSIVFSNEEKMKELQSIVWPEIRSMIVDNIAKQRERGIQAIVIEAAVMIEAGWQDLVDSLWVIRVSEETAKKRLMHRNNLSEEEALKRIHSQLSNEERSRHANVCIDNDDNVIACELEDFVKAAYHKMMT